jgi:hypothetical protein
MDAPILKSPPEGIYENDIAGKTSRFWEFKVRKEFMLFVIGIIIIIAVAGLISSFG